MKMSNLALTTLEKIYVKVFILENFLHEVCPTISSDQFLKELKDECLKIKIQKTIIAISPKADTLPEDFSSNVIKDFHQDILPSVTSYVNEKYGEDHVLCSIKVGNDPHQHIFSPDTLEMWNVIHKRYGDKIVEYILHHCGIFEPITPLTYFQIGGISIIRLLNHHGKQLREIRNYTKKRKLLRSENNEHKIYCTSFCHFIKSRCGFSHSLEVQRKVFYAKRRKEGLPQSRMYHNHITDPKIQIILQDFLQQLEPNEAGVQTLRQFITNTVVSYRNFDCDACTEKYDFTELHLLLKMFLVQHKKCNFKLILNKCCPRFMERGKIISFMSSPKESKSSHKQVFSFIEAVIRQVIPLKLLGSNYNLKLFLQNVKTSISIGKKDRLRVGQFVQGMKVSDCKWVRSFKFPHDKEKFFAKVIIWLVKEYISHILKNYFYITETNAPRYKMEYFRQSVWQSLYHKGVNNLLQKKRVVHENNVKNEAEFYLRFLPKSSSLRPLIIRKKNMDSLNEYKIILAVLRYAGKIYPGCLGADYFTMQHKMVEFIEKSKAAALQGKLYFVKADISDCFSTMIHEKALAVTVKLLKKVFGVESDEMAPQKDNIIYIHEFFYIRMFRNSFQSIPILLPGSSPNAGSCLKESISKTSPYHFYIYKKKHRIVKYTELVELVKKYIFNNFIWIHKQVYRLTEGVPQGGLLSLIICNLYNGAMEEDYLQEYLTNPSGVLIRMTDDYLYISTNKTLVAQFLNIMNNGIPEYNYSFNPSKIGTNFKEDSENNLITYPTELPWCGLVINTQSWNVSLDYGRQSFQSINYTMRMDGRKPGQQLKSRVVRSATIRCKPILFDSKINTIDNIIKNIYKMCLYAACVMDSVYQKLSMNLNSPANVKFLIDTIEETANITMNVLIAHKNKKKLIFPLYRRQVKWLCFYAFKIKLCCNPQYKDVVECLTKMIKEVSQRLNKLELIHWKTNLLQFPEEFKSFLL